MIPFILNTIILTQSRAAALATIASLPAAWYLTPKVYRRFVSMAVVLAAVLFLTLVNEEFWNRISSTLGFMDETTQEARLQIIGPEFRMFLDHPLGAGHHGNEFLSPQYIPEQFLTSDSGTRSAHNTFMAALVDQGFPGAILLTGLYVWVGVSLRRLRRLDAQGLPPLLGLYRAALGTALVSCFVSGLFSNMLNTEVQIWLVALLASLVARSKNAVEQSNISNLPVAAKKSCR
jgi:O-antigen ligase